jgi:hypothetical protein
MAERYKSHQFTPDKQPKVRGRKKGKPNRLTAVIKDAVEGALDDIGEMAPIYEKVRTVKGRVLKVDGKPVMRLVGWKPTGKDGARGFFRWLGVHEPTTFAGVAAKIIPQQINAQVKHDHEHTINSRFEGVDLSKLNSADLQTMMREALNLTKPLPPKQLELQAEEIVDEQEEAA